MFGLSPLRLMLWLVTSDGFKVVELPYEVVVPYSTCEEFATFVVQVIVAPLAVIPDSLTAEMVGDVVLVAVVKDHENGAAMALPAASLAPLTVAVYLVEGLSEPVGVSVAVCVVSA